jgi:trimethylamine:corrinoid methyltransferase-like protein
LTDSYPRKGCGEPQERYERSARGPRSSGYRIPIAPAFIVSMDASGPATMAGAIPLQVAEMMGWVVMTQLHTPGAPSAICHAASPLDMRTGYRLMGLSSRGVGGGMMNQMLRKYKVPIWGNIRTFSNSKVIDFQAGFEKSSGTLLDALKRSSLLISRFPSQTIRSRR